MDQTSWHDITEAFRGATAGLLRFPPSAYYFLELGVGELLHDDAYTLYESLTSVELMDPKMDSGFVHLLSFLSYFRLCCSICLFCIVDS
jgi:hypothetical protein